MVHRPNLGGDFISPHQVPKWRRTEAS